MTTNKPEVEMTLIGGEQLVRLSDYERLQAETERLQAEREKLRTAMIEAKPYIDHYMYGGSIYREPAAKAVALIDAALSAYREQQGGEA